MKTAEQKELRMHKFAKCSGIPFHTFRKYVCSDSKKRRKLGSRAGAPQLIGEDTAVFVVDVLRRKDRANDSLNKRAAVDMLQDLQPGAKRKALEQAFDRNIRSKHKDKLSGIIKTQPSTPKRSATTVAKQFRWHTMCASPIYDICCLPRTHITHNYIPPLPLRNSDG